ncbi:MAG TPA: dethiobiotin synthase [Sphingobacteriaceae bacterium]|nr:dethiobiotin synthase [Sphingobacteriaceae bacterium]
MRPLFITGIGTGIGKTIVAAILTEKLQADYWKPIQSGDLDNSDTERVKSLVSNSLTQFHPEAYKLSQPFSPHKSAALDGIKIELGKIILPETDNRLIIEGAGGLMVPLNEKDMIIDLIKQLDAEVILVSKNYLGSINHTLLSLEMLKIRNIPLKGIIFNGESDSYSEDLILNFSGAKALARIPVINNLNKSSVSEIGTQLDELKL